MNERNRDHYSNKGGHRERSSHWRDVERIVKLLGRTFTYSPTQQLVLVKEQAHIIRRSMLRDPQDGRR